MSNALHIAACLLARSGSDLQKARVAGNSMEKGRNKQDADRRSLRILHAHIAARRRSLKH